MRIPRRGHIIRPRRFSKRILYFVIALCVAGLLLYLFSGSLFRALGRFVVCDEAPVPSDAVIVLNSRDDGVVTLGNTNLAGSRVNLIGSVYINQSGAYYPLKVTETGTGGNQGFYAVYAP